MVLQNYNQNFIEMTSNMIYIVEFGGGLKCPLKIHLNTQWGEIIIIWNFRGPLFYKQEIIRANIFARTVLLIGSRKIRTLFKDFL